MKLSYVDLIAETRAIIARDEANLSTTRHGMKRRGMLANRKSLLAALEAALAQEAQHRGMQSRSCSIHGELLTCPICDGQQTQPDIRATIVSALHSVPGGLTDTSYGEIADAILLALLKH